ncbi:carbohydrate ABC transporter permease [Paenibacillus sp. BC26]|uniref:carbohydrate ABC transporter permease n=1 Tax=Paenibacillus sp. BC26 TaxID=1881032 RepID=UPI0008E53A1F|nr:carbohydrate ABC transporter permease [Paenibacillus sp. BC26]SFS51616.1 putative aldouronate transport system permease protein [Paenibacillus sp. BC26]
MKVVTSAAVHTISRKSYHANSVSQWTNLLIVILFAGYSLLCLIPVLLVLIVSFSDEQSITLHGYSFYPSRWSVEAYLYLFRDGITIARAYGATITATVLGTAVGLLMTASFAFPLSKPDFKYRNIFAFYAFFTLLFNGGLVPWYIVFSKYLKLGNTIWALILPGLLMNAFYVMLIRTFYQSSIPVEIYESAQIDGANEIRVFVQIVIPLSLPVLTTIGLFYTLAYWNDWNNSMIFQSRDQFISLQYLMNRTLLNLQYLLQNNQAAAQAQVDFPGESVRMAMAIAGIGPILFAYPFFQKYLVKGLTVGAVKG